MFAKKVNRSIVAFCDVLGYKNMMYAKAGSVDELNDELQRISSAIAQAEQWIDYSNLKSKFFTDNLVISAIIGDDDVGESALGTMLSALAMYQLVMTSHGYFIRGGIEAGYHYMNDKIVFGDAIVVASCLESKHAIYPRILVGDQLSDLIKVHKRWYGNKEDRMPHFSYLKRDCGMLFLDYLEGGLSFSDDDYGAIMPLIHSHKTHIESNLLKHSLDAKVLEKFQWLKAYHNQFCEHHVPLANLVI